MKVEDVALQNKMCVTFEQQDKAIKQQLKIIEKLQRRVKAEQRRKNQLASQLKKITQQ
ncbi:hypothetical protein UAW_02652 [Enterococcus haemoperoxidus ATCC BAA-382]|uniref:Uncharacterized protein n=1 Tax=Enterococcus haemoperoxidus ATCC BAA-382 TaxID=1158608 RepID=R2SZG3_9ENTE|nr:hypothetical protein [Enterococcus haemoperoxidus]EOH93404.1 hypothetical protein UAW_02652 [Enterococcus haemoperoxidus ATCC BAA-382]EOT61358.1 hypothetical protein I583_00336 [Enterococcus haemoperoxidus ATCC BAA-382]